MKDEGWGLRQALEAGQCRSRRSQCTSVATVLSTISIPCDGTAARPCTVNLKDDGHRWKTCSNHPGTRVEVDICRLISITCLRSANVNRRPGSRRIVQSRWGIAPQPKYSVLCEPSGPLSFGLKALTVQSPAPANLCTRLAPCSLTHLPPGLSQPPASDASVASASGGHRRPRAWQGETAFLSSSPTTRDGSLSLSLSKFFLPFHRCNTHQLSTLQVFSLSSSINQ